MRAAPAGEAVRILESLPSVRATVIGGDEIRIDAGNLAPAVLVRALVLGGVEVSEVTGHRESLEHHFLQLTADRRVRA
jgi:hypothetical protein